MRCTLIKNFSSPQFIQPRKMLLSKKKRESSINERVHYEEAYEMKSTMESERLGSQISTLRSTQSLTTYFTENKPKQFYEFENHPLYLNLSDSQYDKFLEFKEIAHEEFANFD